MLNHHYRQHCYEPLPMLSVKDFMKSLDKNQFVFKIIVQTENFTNQTYPENCHIHFDDDSILITSCKVSNKDFVHN